MQLKGLPEDNESGDLSHVVHLVSHLAKAATSSITEGWSHHSPACFCIVSTGRQWRLILKKSKKCTHSRARCIGTEPGKGRLCGDELSHLCILMQSIPRCSSGNASNDSTMRLVMCQRTLDTRRSCISFVFVLSRSRKKTLIKLHQDHTWEANMNPSTSSGSSGSFYCTMNGKPLAVSGSL